MSLYPNPSALLDRERSSSFLRVTHGENLLSQKKNKKLLAVFREDFDLTLISWLGWITFETKVTARTGRRSIPTILRKG